MILKYKHLSDEVLLTETYKAAKREQQMTLELLDYLIEVERRKVFATLNCSSMHNYVIKVLGYSSGQASERVNAMRLMRDHLEVRAKVETGALTLTSAAQIQRFVQVEKKAGTTIAKEQTKDLIERCTSQSTRVIERILLDEASDQGEILMKEKMRALPKNRTELKFSIGDKTEEKLQHIKNLVGNLSLEDLFDRALEEYIKQEEKKRGFTRALVQQKRSGDRSGKEGTHAINGTQSKKTSLKPRTPAQQKSRYIPIEFKRGMFNRSDGQCEFIDEKTGLRCESRYRVQNEHRIPLALGGKTEFQNLRHFCFQHNARAAIEAGLWKK